MSYTSLARLTKIAEVEESAVIAVVAVEDGCKDQPDEDWQHKHLPKQQGQDQHSAPAVPRARRGGIDGESREKQGAERVHVPDGLYRVRRIAERVREATLKVSPATPLVRVSRPRLTLIINPVVDPMTSGFRTTSNST